MYIRSDYVRHRMCNNNKLSSALAPTGTNNIFVGRCNVTTERHRFDGMLTVQKEKKEIVFGPFALQMITFQFVQSHAIDFRPNPICICRTFTFSLVWFICLVHSVVSICLVCKSWMNKSATVAFVVVNSTYWINSNSLSYSIRSGTKNTHTNWVDSVRVRSFAHSMRSFLRWNSEQDKAFDDSDSNPHTHKYFCHKPIQPKNHAKHVSTIV